jgi:hypothetical protein
VDHRPRERAADREPSVRGRGDRDATAGLAEVPGFVRRATKPPDPFATFEATAGFADADGE